MRNLPAALAAHFQNETLTLAMCCRVTRTSDGRVLGFTTHDRDLVIGGVTYEAASSLEATALRSQVTNNIAAADNMEFVGLLLSDRITESDLLAGLYDGADVEYFTVNWSDLAAGRVVMLTGTIGAVKVSDGTFSAEVRSLAQRLNQQIGDVTTKGCRVKQFGDAQCDPPGGIAAYQLSGSVFSANANRRELVVSGAFSAAQAAAGYFSYGVIEFLTGANAGLRREVKTHGAAGGRAAIELQVAVPFALAAGDSVRLTAGCNRAFATCKTKFNNVVHFRGEPHIPGNDVLVKRGRQTL